MSMMIYLTAATAKAILCFIDPVNTPKIAYDKDELAHPLIDKVKESVGSRDGSQNIYISFSDDEKELQRQFSMVCKNVSTVFDDVHSMTTE